MADSNQAPRIGQRGQLTVPSRIRKHLRLQAGDCVNLICRGDELVVLPAKKPLLDLRGSVPGKGPQDLQAIRAEVLSEHVRQRIPSW